MENINNRVSNSLLNLSSDLIAYIDTDFNFVFANLKFQEFFNNSDLNLFDIGSPFGSVHQKIIIRMISSSFSSQKNISTEFTLIKNGMDYLVSIKSVPDMFEGEVIGISLVIRNISISDNYENSDFHSKLKFKKELFKKLFTKTNDGFFAMFSKRPIDWSISNSKDALLDEAFNELKVEYANDSFINQYNSNYDSIFGLTPKDFYLKNIVYGKNQWRSLFEKGFIQFETEHRRSDGTLLWMECDFFCNYDDENRINGVFGFQKDVTNKKFEEFAKLENQMNFETFFNLNYDMFFVIDLHGTILKTNKTVFKRLKYSSDELEGKSVLDVYAEDYKESFANVINDIHNFKNKSIHFPLVTKDNIVIQVETRIVSGSWNGKSALFTISKDLSEVKKSEEKLSKVFHNNSTFMTLYDSSDYSILDINEIFINKLEYNREDVIGKSLYDLNIFLDINQFEEVKNIIKSEGSLKNFEVTLKSNSNEIFHCSLSASVINTYDQDFLLTVMIDITDKKRTQLLLEESEKRYKIIFNGTNEGIIVANSETGKFLYANNSLCEMIGYSLEEILNFHFTEIHPSEVRDDVINGFNSLTDNMQRLNSNVPILKNDGSIIYADIKDKIVYFDNIKTNLAFITDVTQRRESELEKENLFNELDIANRNLEELLFEKNLLVDDLAEKEIHLEKVISEKDKFFSIIAHDLKEPFNGFLGFTEIMKNSLYNMSLNEMTKFSTVLHTSASNLYKLLENLLNWAQIQRNVMEFSPTTFEINNLISECTNLIELTLSKKDIKLNFIFDEKIEIYADLNMISSIIRNLLTNAIKFSNKNSNIEVKSYIYDSNCIISVKDNGVGIKQSDKEKIFSIENKISNTGTEGELSTGLGLILSNEYIKLNNGKIWFESEFGKGSTFFISIPLLNK